VVVIQSFGAVPPVKTARKTGTCIANIGDIPWTPFVFPL
jgi:hypothetical protein